MLLECKVEQLLIIMLLNKNNNLQHSRVFNSSEGCKVMPQIVCLVDLVLR